MDWRENAKLSATAIKLTGERHCRSCDRYKPVTGGKVRIGANGRPIWRCATCTQRKNGAGFR